jgi:predicted cytidylate kinase
MMDSITIGGLPGSGTTTTARRLQNTLDLPYVYVGDLFREMARDRGMSLLAFGIYCENHPEVDRALDKKQEVMLMAGNLILEGRLAGWIAFQHSIPAFKIWLVCEKGERVRRVAERENVARKNLGHQLQIREDSERDRFRNYYEIDLDNLSIYDVVIDTTNISPLEVEKTVLESMPPKPLKP